MAMMRCCFLASRWAASTRAVSACRPSASYWQSIHHCATFAGVTLMKGQQRLIQRGGLMQRHFRILMLNLRMLCQ